MNKDRIKNARTALLDHGLATGLTPRSTLKGRINRWGSCVCRTTGWVALVLLFLIPAVEAQASTPNIPSTLFGKVIRVVNCDTLVLQRHRKEMRVRLNGIDCPERTQPYGKVAHRYITFMTVGLEVNVRVVGEDRNGTPIGDVILPDGRILNPLVIEEGLAWWDRSPNSDPKLAEVEEFAQASKKGLWQDPYPIAPWEWRKGRRAPEP